MNSDGLFITVNHINDYGGVTRFRVGDELLLKKDLNNPYDDEAIAVYSLPKEIKCGFVANSVCSVARGTCSAGRLYEKIGLDSRCVIRFITEDLLICEIM